MNLGVYFQAGCPALYIRTVEEERALSAILSALKESGLRGIRVYIWKPTTGLYQYGMDPRHEMLKRGLHETFAAIAPPQNPVSDCVYIFFRIHYYLDNPEIVQHLRDAAWVLRGAGSHLVFIGPHADFPPELQEIFTVVDFDHPTRDELSEIIREMVLTYSMDLSEQPTEEKIVQAAEAAKGMTIFRTEAAAALSFVERGTLDVSVIQREKRQMLKHTEAVQYVETDETFRDLGGFKKLKEHVLRRKTYFNSLLRAQSAGILSPPKGLFLVGLPGTGKTLSAKCIASALELPLYRLDVGSLFRSYVGESESMTRRALKLVEAAAPVVLLLDEFEKAFSGLDSSGRADSGVTSRVISTILSWMQDCTAPIYKVATANSLRNLDSAMLRRGRWDAVFAVDLPNGEEVREILRIHLRKRGYDPDIFDIERLKQAMVGFVGSEIESVIEEAIYRALSSDETLSDAHLLEVASETIPLSVTDREEIEFFRDWIKGRAQTVS